MNVLFLTDNFPPEVNAAANRVYERACYWVKWGHEVTIITCAPNFPEGKVYSGYQNRWYQESTIDGIRVIRVKTLIAANKGTFWRILDFLSFMVMSVLVGIGVKRPDVVVATSPQFFAGVSGWLLSCFKRRPFVLELSDLWPDSIEAVGAFRSKLLLTCLKKWAKQLYNSSTAIVTLTEAFQQNLINQGVEPEKIAVIRNGVDVNRFEPIPRDDELKTQLGFGSNQRIVGYIGTLGMAHNLHNVLLAAFYLQEQQGVGFLFVGSGALKNELKAIAESWGLNNVVFVDRQPKSEIARYWSICDVALVHLKNHPVFAEAIPSKLFEAMVMKKPVLLTMPEGEASDIVLKEGVGHYARPDDPTELAYAIDQITSDPTKAKVMREAAGKAAHKYSREAQAKEMIDVLIRVSPNEAKL